MRTMSTKNYFLLTLKNRECIEKWKREGVSHTEIACRIGCDISTIGREVTRGRDSQGIYCAVYAHKKSVSRIRSRKLGKRKILQNSVLQQEVHTGLRNKWSPCQIAKKLREGYTDKAMNISHESIYQYIYVLPRGSLKKTLTEGLRRSHKYRHTHRKQEQDEEMRGKIKDMLSIHERPVEVADRTIPGHWEGDLIIGKYKRTAIATLVERTTRYTMLVPLPHGKDALSVREAMTKKLTALPSHIRKTLTYDQGKEMSQHTQFTIDTGIQVFFADPASPWQRGTNENTNGLIRQYFPKGTDFSLVSDKELQEAEDSLNGRPRKCIDWQFPKDVFFRLVAVDSGN
jgi:transposase, IS30 family